MDKEPGEAGTSGGSSVVAGSSSGGDGPTGGAATGSDGGAATGGTTNTGGTTETGGTAETGETGGTGPTGGNATGGTTTAPFSWAVTLNNVNPFTKCEYDLDPTCSPQKNPGNTCPDIQTGTKYPFEPKVTKYYKIAPNMRANLVFDILKWAHEGTSFDMMFYNPQLTGTYTIKSGSGQSEDGIPGLQCLNDKRIIRWIELKVLADYDQVWTFQIPMLYPGTLVGTKDSCVKIIHREYDCYQDVCGGSNYTSYLKSKGLDPNARNVHEREFLNCVRESVENKKCDNAHYAGDIARVNLRIPDKYTLPLNERPIDDRTVSYNGTDFFYYFNAVQNALTPSHPDFCGK